MQLFKYIDRINLMDKLIRQRRTGAPQELAARLGLSLSRLARIVEYMRDMGAPIKYDRISMTYHYTHDYSIQIRVEVQELTQQQMENISGGSFLKKISPMLFLCIGHT